MLLQIERRICPSSSVNESSVSRATVAAGEEVAIAAVLLPIIHDCAGVVVHAKKLEKISESKCWLKHAINFGLFLRIVPDWANIRKDDDFSSADRGPVLSAD